MKNQNHSHSSSKVLNQKIIFFASVGVFVAVIAYFVITNILTYGTSMSF